MNRWDAFFDDPFKPFVPILVAAVVMGMLAVWQIKVQDRLAIAKQPESQEIVALEVARLTNANAELRQRLASLSQQEFTLASSLSDRQTAEKSLGQQRSQADILNGSTAVTGPGIRLTINFPLSLNQQVDLIDAIENIGADAMTVNGNRVTWQFSPWRVELTPPFVFEVIGSPAGLSSSLTRKGGIIDQIKETSGSVSYKIDQVDVLTLPAGTVQPAVYAQAVEH